MRPFLNLCIQHATMCSEINRTKITQVSVSNNIAPMFLALNLRVHTSKGELVPVTMLKFLTWATEIKPSRKLKFSNFSENMAVAIFRLVISEGGGLEIVLM